ncbi:MAG: N-6 DNA methylase [Chitinophagales bacterium]|nr:N-6 DNA methylase [Chitinophagales bacterium]
MKTKADLENTFGVSPATIQNWIKTRLIPSPSTNGYYTDNTFEEIKSIIDNHDSKLKFRANRKRNTERFIHNDTLDNNHSADVVEQIIEVHQHYSTGTELTLLALAVVLLEKESLVAVSGKEIVVTQSGSASAKFKQFLNEWLYNSDSNSFSELYEHIKTAVGSVNEFDLLGTVYQSIRTTSEKSASGAYFTPTQVLGGISILPHEKVIDPCCGSGRMLLNSISPQHSPNLLYARDTDEIALKICRVNFALFFKSTAINPHIEKRDFIFGATNQTELFNTGNPEKFDVVISNPPWGAKFSTNEKKSLFSKYPELKTTESFAVCLYNAIQLLNEEGRLYFMLPESVLSVDTHYSIRKYFMNHTKSQKVWRFGNAFKNVVSKVIRLDLFKHIEDEAGLSVIDKSSRIKIPKDILRNDTLQIPVVSNDYEVEIIRKMFAGKHSSLQGNCVFGLGIVTGNNAQHILDMAVKHSEPVYKGKDIVPFRMNFPETHIVFKPENFQQVAPVDLYRQKKICYRFISSNVVMALDTNGSLLLNSANFFIPQAQLPFEVIVTLFNSSVITFFYQRVFNSIKLLRNHIEDFPLPLLAQNDIDRLLQLHKSGTEGKLDIQEVNKYVGGLYGLTDEQIQYISKAVNKHGP